MERIWVSAPGHPIAEGLGRYFELPGEETYGEPFSIPEPDKLLLIGNYSGGEVFRSGVTFRRGRGRIFYFQPGHEEYPIYHHPDIQRIITNAVRWAYNENNRIHTEIPVEKTEPLEKTVD